MCHLEYGFRKLNMVVLVFRVNNHYSINLTYYQYQIRCSSPSYEVTCLSHLILNFNVYFVDILLVYVHTVSLCFVTVKTSRSWAADVQLSRDCCSGGCRTSEYWCTYVSQIISWHHIGLLCLVILMGCWLGLIFCL